MQNIRDDVDSIKNVCVCSWICNDVEAIMSITRNFINKTEGNTFCDYKMGVNASRFDINNIESMAGFENIKINKC